MPAWALEETPAVHTCKMSSRSRNHSQLSSLYELMLESSKLPTVIFCACQCTTYFSKLLSKCNRHLAIHSRKNCWDAVKDNHEVQPFCHSPLQWKKEHIHKSQGRVNSRSVNADCTILAWTNCLKIELEVASVAYCMPWNFPCGQFSWIHIYVV